MNKKLLVAVIFAIAATVAGLQHPAKQSSPAPGNTVSYSSGSGTDISVLTRQQRVVDYLRKHQRLPDYYLRKSEARKQGWDPASGNLCDAVPGRAIGGDRFSNREKVLPETQGRLWFEADVNYRCGRRGSDRMLYSSDGLIYLTRDHYRHVEEVN